jgi:Family of unknown function (DUF5908)
MPIVVDEVVISIDVAPAAPGVGDPPGTPGTSGGNAEASRQQLVSDCVERVLEILAERKER